MVTLVPVLIARAWMPASAECPVNGAARGSRGRHKHIEVPVIGVPAMKRQGEPVENLPACVIEYINHVIRKMGYSHSARRDVRQELIDHFTDALSDYSDERERQKQAEELIAEFGDAKLLAVLLRRAKKRNRPAWVKALIRTGQAMVLLIVGWCLYATWILLGTPTLSVNYLDQLNQSRKPSVPAKDNAWSHYERVIELYKESPKTVVQNGEEKPWPDPSTRRLDGLGDAELADLHTWIDQNEPAWREYVLASQVPYCWFPYTVKHGRESGGPPMMVFKLPKLYKIRGLTRMGVWKARLAAADGHYDKAFETCMTILRVARHWQRPGDIAITQLVGMAIANAACDEIMQLAEQASVSPETLGRWQQKLADAYADGYPLFNPEGERYNLLDCVQYTYTDSGPGGGHLIPRQLMRLMKYTDDPNDNALAQGSRDEGLALQFLAALGSAVQAGRDETIREGNAIYDLWVKQATMTPYERRKAPDVEKMITALPVYRYILLDIILPNMGRAGNLSWESRTEYEAAMTILALKRYHAEHGAYPAMLEDLVAGHYLQHVPMDPYSAQALRYARRGDDFVLYSVGEDFQDDGGVQNAKEPWARAAVRSEPAIYGDRVFWPVQPVQVAASQSRPS